MSLTDLLRQGNTRVSVVWFQVCDVLEKAKLSVVQTSRNRIISCENDGRGVWENLLLQWIGPYLEGGWLSRTLKGLRFYPACKIASLPANLVDAGRRHKTSGSDKELYYPQHNKQFQHHVCIGSSCPLSLKQVTKRGPDWCCVCSKLVSELKILKLQEPESFIKGSKCACPLLWKKTVSYYTGW